MTRQVSETQRTAHLFGTGVMALGGLLFASSFVAFLLGMGSTFNGMAFHGLLPAWLGFGGMLLLVLGIVIRTIAARGLAGSGIILDPRKARQDLEPYTRMAGGMVKDALDEAEIKIGSSQPEQVIMIKCPACANLNEQDSKFCRECGHKF